MLMAFGKSIRLFLKEGTVTGIKFGEVVNHTIQSIACPRVKLSELSEIKEARRPGVYFLFGKDEQTNEDMAYIGEAENVFERLQNHLISKDFWNEVIFFISKDENLTKSHVKYLESRLIQIALLVRRFNLENANQPQLPSLPLADRDSMEEFLLQIKMLTGIMGHKILEEVITSYTKMNTVDQKKTTPAHLQVEGLELFLSVSGMNAKAIVTNEGLVVITGSDATANITASLSNGYRELRQTLIDSGSLQFEDDRYKFQKDVLFSSPSAAAALVVGYSYNGRHGWRDKSGRTLKSIEQENIQKISDGLDNPSSSAL